MRGETASVVGMTPIRQACVLVGGKGTRLGDLTRTTPKPLMQISDNRVFLDFVIEQLARQGFDDIVLLAGYLGDTVRARYAGNAPGTARIRVIIENEPLGTAGAIAAARDSIAPQFLMLNGDSFFDIDLRALCAAGKDRDALIALHRVADASRYGSIMLDGERVVRFVEKRPNAGAASINGGIYVLRASVFERIRTLPCSLEADVFPALAAERRLYGRECEGYFIDIGLPESLEQARRELIALAHRPAVVAR